MTFFANEFAGRVATKVMQTSLAVRECVMKILDVFVYVVTYFLDDDRRHRGRPTGG